MHVLKYEAPDSQLDERKNDLVLLTRKRPSESIDYICSADTEEEALQNSKAMSRLFRMYSHSI